MLSAVCSARPAPIAGVRSWVGWAGHRRVRVVQTGVGCERARVAAALVCEDGTKKSPRCFLSTGCAGALRPDLSTGDLVLATRTVEQDGAAATPDLGACARVLTSWAAANGVVLHPGPFYSVGRPLFTAAEKRAAWKDQAAIVVEMESAAIARVAAARDVSFAAVRCILDPASVSIHEAAAAAGREPTDRRQASREIARLLPARRKTKAALLCFFRVLVESGGVDALTEV